MLDDLGRRIKRDYEDALRLYLPRRAFVIVRVDGRAFHVFTRGMERPYCRPLADALDTAAIQLSAEMTGCQFAFGQSDEYSFLLSDAVWFDGNVQKIASVSASIFTAAFARAFVSDRPATFDARVFLIPQRSEVAQYFIWRQMDASANSLNMLASAHYTHEELLGRSTADKHELLHAKGLNWAKEPADFKRGRVVRPGETGWVVDREIPVFQREPGYLDALIPSAD